MPSEFIGMTRLDAQPSSDDQRDARDIFFPTVASTVWPSAASSPKMAEAE